MSVLTPEERALVDGYQAHFAGFGLDPDAQIVRLVAIIDRLVALLQTPKEDVVIPLPKVGEIRVKLLQAPSASEIEAIRERAGKRNHPDQVYADRDTLLRAVAALERERDEARRTARDYQTVYHAKWRQLDSATDRLCDVEQELAELRAWKAKVLETWRSCSGLEGEAVDEYMGAVLGVKEAGG